MDQFARCKVERQESWRAQTVIAMVDRPESVETIDRDPEDRIEQLLLRGAVGKRHGGTVDELEQFVAFRTCFRVHRKEYPARAADGDIADRLGITEDIFEHLLAEYRRRGEVHIGLAATVPKPEYDHQRQKYQE